VAWIVALTALLLLGLVLFWRQATFEARLARSRQELVDSLSHTLKTPLARVRLLAENLQQGWVSGEEKRSEFLRAIVAESDRLDALIRRMLDLPGPEGKARAFDLRSRLLAPLLEEAARRFCGRHGGTVVLSLELDRSLPPARVDAGMLAEAVDELLGNAVKYAGPGGRFALRLRRSGRRAAIEVEDDGPGLRWRDRRRLFTRYFRSDSARAAAVEGSGLGLSLVAGVARAHGGRATVRSRPGRGSCFSILIPLEEIHGRHPAG
jgi:signal transduction histidine kinase